MNSHSLSVNLSDKLLWELQLPWLLIFLCHFVEECHDLLKHWLLDMAILLLIVSFRFNSWFWPHHPLHLEGSILSNLLGNGHQAVQQLLSFRTSCRCCNDEIPCEYKAQIRIFSKVNVSVNIKDGEVKRDVDLAKSQVNRDSRKYSKSVFWHSLVNRCQLGRWVGTSEYVRGPSRCQSWDMHEWFTHRIAVSCCLNATWIFNLSWIDKETKRVCAHPAQTIVSR